MREIVIISGKGGTGKTSITAAFASLARNAVFADCDVDAADLHLILNPEIRKTVDFYSGYEAVIDQTKCLKCGKCAKLCRFGAVGKKNDSYYIDSIECEGCGVCFDNCKYKAVELRSRLCGQWYASKTRFGPMVHAKLGIGAENSGKLVTAVRNEAKKIASETNAELILIDGPPGIGCPVIASITGSSAVLAVTEPTLSGRHDLRRVVELTRHFSVPLFVCLNKFDINPEISKLISDESEKSGAQVLGCISYDKNITRAQIEGKSIIELGNSKASDEIKNIWRKIYTKI